MKVYRYLSEEELNKILSGDTKDLGRCYTIFIVNKKKVVSTFNYEKGEKYLHFFRKKEDMERIRRIHRGNDNVNNVKRQYYYCTFDIHPTILWFAAGKGFYNNYDENDKRVKGITPVKEYAIKTKHFNPNWLVEYVKDCSIYEGRFEVERPIIDEM